MKFQIVDIKTLYAATPPIWKEPYQHRDLTIFSVLSFYPQQFCAYLSWYGCWYGYADL